ncbi:O-antigen ligase family protein [Actinomycetospora rhizophila]|uniref:O-antigen ligase family protein n=1 Tax=Actinomycetospora rhizophila TaxID=1416876 RepID=A0ABV9ZNU2_9PSEU
MRQWVAPVAMSGFVMAGDFKAAPPFSYLPFDLTVVLALVVVILIAFRVLFEPIPPAVFGVLLGFAVLVPSALLAGDTPYASEKVTRLFTLTLLSAAAPIFLVLNGDDLIRHVWAWTGWCGFVVASGLVDPQYSDGSTDSAISSESADTIALGVAAGLVVVVLGMGLIYRITPWWLALAGGTIACIVLLQSGSRGPLISVLVAVVLTVMVVRLRPPKLRAGVVAALIGGGLFASFQLAPAGAQGRISSFLEGENTGTVRERNGLYENALNSIDRQPFGLGMGNFSEVAPDPYVYPHNLPLEVLAEAGVFLGGLFLVWIMVWLWRAQRASHQFATVTSLCILVYVLAVTMSTGDLNNNRAFFYALGLTAAISGVLSGVASDQFEKVRSRASSLV